MFHSFFSSSPPNFFFPRIWPFCGLVLIFAIFLREKSQREWHMTKDEDKQRSVLILSAFDIAACQQVLFQKQYKGGVDLWIVTRKKNKWFVRLELKRSNYITIATKSQLKARQIWSQQRFECLNIFSPQRIIVQGSFFFLPWTFFQQNDDNGQDRYLNANATQPLRTSHDGHFQNLGGW